MAEVELTKFKKLRFYLAWPAAILCFLAAKPTAVGFWVGVPITAIGEAFRIWSQGCIEKGTRLATSGPYAYLRNPLYFSNFLIGLGFVVMLSNLWIFLLYLTGFFILYRGTIFDEEKFLASRYGAQFQKYCEKVPRFIPTLKPYPKSEEQPFEWKLVWRHGESITFLAITLLFFVLYGRRVWFGSISGFYADHTQFVWLTAASACLLLISVFYRKFKSA